MPATDPIADMLTRIRNANTVGHEKTSMPSSTLKVRLADVLKAEGYLSDYKVVEPPGGGPKQLTVWLRRGPDGEKVLQHVERVSKPGRRVYRGAGELGKVMDGLGVSIVSTSRGLMSDRAARKLKLGGEVLCNLW